MSREDEHGFDDDDQLPLQNTWCLWHDKFTGNASAEQYAASLKKLCSFSTVQEFWQCFNNLPDIKRLALKSSFHMMKDGIKPLWEDPANANGGVWVLRVSKEDTPYVWSELTMAAIGEQFAPVLAGDESDDICGITISVRGADNIVYVWNRNAHGRRNAILDKIRALLPDATIRAAFYKPSQAHDAYGKAT